MTPTVLVLVSLLAALVVGIVVFRRMSRPAQQGSGLADLGVVSARWISELRRDEPWSGS
jgi:hypothetical protein